MHKEKKLLSFGSTLTDIYLIYLLAVKKIINPASRERSENFANVLKVMNKRSSNVQCLFKALWSLKMSSNVSYAIHAPFMERFSSKTF